jgi:hypothetical protein
VKWEAYKLETATHDLAQTRISHQEILLQEHEILQVEITRPAAVLKDSALKEGFCTRLGSY